ncbi:hypothetical protein ABE218_11190 [Bacillus smithii]|jgi:hypothetical protein|uniref:hypothetical protein n=1 Tax=Bacillus smithii TaxID=1479 RepID=UPI003D2332AD
MTNIRTKKVDMLVEAKMISGNNLDDASISYQRILIERNDGMVIRSISKLNHCHLLGIKGVH